MYKRQWEDREALKRDIQDICDAIEEGITVADYERKSKAAMDDHGPDQDRDGDAVTIAVIVAGLLFMIYDVLSSFVPVSYTHLDVYKRQILEIVHANKTADFITVGEELDRRKRLDAVGGLAYITSLANESVSYNVEAVSYTHLDVYKRQAKKSLKQCLTLFVRNTLSLSLIHI